VAFIREQLGCIPAGEVAADSGTLSPNSLAVALNEGWRGEVCHVAITDGKGAFSRYKIVDPSFHNWPALAYALRDQDISDFPICNKSFNLSYCGHDL
jgi:Ni,Fe-hydrogenase III large subunit